jgi:hypothetical protein
LNLRPLANSSVFFVALGYGVLLSIATAAGWFGIVLVLLLWLSIWRYSYEVLRTIMQGRAWIPAPDADTMNPFGEGRLLMHFVFLGAALAFFQTTPFFGEGFAGDLIRWTGTVLLWVAFPASAALMSITLNAGAALNPASVLGVIQTMGADYAKLLLVCAALVLLTELLPAVLGSGLLAALLRNVASVWGMLAVFALIGGAIREHRDDFDIPGERKDEEEVRTHDREREWQRALDRAYASIRGGLPAEGYRTIKELLAAENDGVDAYQWVFNRMLEWEDRSHALQFATRFIERLVAAGREHGALELVAQCRRLWKDFAVPPVAAARLEEYARMIGRHGAADELTPFSRHAPRP